MTIPAVIVVVALFLLDIVAEKAKRKISEKK